MSKKTWMNVRSIPKESGKVVEVLGSSDASSDLLTVYEVTYDKSIGCFLNQGGWVVTPFAWREVSSASKPTLDK